ncbi:MAG: hypothetical protein KJZ84_14270 [Bryobacteraceae bacterium]|nr:hypothetical protein [Bryobacteraceae bacterium]
MSLRNAVAMVVLAAALGGCFWRKRPAPAPPPPPPPLPAPVQPQPPEPMPPPGIEPRQEELPVEPAPSVERTELPPAPKSPAAPRRRVTPAPAAPPAPEPEEEAVAAPAPQLGEVLKPETRAALQAQYDSATAQARQDLDRISGQKLNAGQAQSAARARAFLAQAEGMVATDPRSAAELARRAALLARDLANSVR